MLETFYWISLILAIFTSMFAHICIDKRDLTLDDACLCLILSVIPVLNTILTMFACFYIMTNSTDIVLYKNDRR